MIVYCISYRNYTKTKENHGIGTLWTKEITTHTEDGDKTTTITGEILVNTWDTFVIMRNVGSKEIIVETDDELDKYWTKVIK